MCYKCGSTVLGYEWVVTPEGWIRLWHCICGNWFDEFSLCNRLYPPQVEDTPRRRVTLPNHKNK